MMKIQTLFLIAAIAAITCTCSDPKLSVNSGGGGSGIETKTIVGKVIPGNDSAASGVSVLFQPTDSSEVLDSTSTDFTGNYKFLIKKSGPYNITYRKNSYITKTNTDTIQFSSSDDAVIRLDTVTLEEIPIPKNIYAEYDSMTGVVSVKWDSVALHNKLYEINVFRSITDTRTFLSIQLDTPFYADTLFQVITDTTSAVTKKYMVKISLTDGITGKWSTPCTVSAKRPRVPPAPAFSLKNIYGTRDVTISYSFPQLWWIDSIVVFRSIKGYDTSRGSDTYVLVASLPVDDDRSYTDTIKPFPLGITDSFLPVTYFLRTKSRYAMLSEASRPESLEVVHYSLGKPSIPWFNMPDTFFDQEIQFPIDPLVSPVPRDTLEYRLLISGTFPDSSLSNDSTKWYMDLPIDATFIKAGKYELHCQARSRRFSTLLSPLSDARELIVSRK